jgi:hypothetical protein
MDGRGANVQFPWMGMMGMSHMATVHASGGYTPAPLPTQATPQPAASNRSAGIAAFRELGAGSSSAGKRSLDDVPAAESPQVDDDAAFCVKRNVRISNQATKDVLMSKPVLDAALQGDRVIPGSGAYVEHKSDKCHNALPNGSACWSNLWPGGRDEIKASRDRSYIRALSLLLSTVSLHVPSAFCSALPPCGLALSCAVLDSLW